MFCILVGVPVLPVLAVFTTHTTGSLPYSFEFWTRTNTVSPTVIFFPFPQAAECENVAVLFTLNLLSLPLTRQQISKSLATKWLELNFFPPLSSSSLSHVSFFSIINGDWYAQSHSHKNLKTNIQQHEKTTPSFSWCRAGKVQRRLHKLSFLRYVWRQAEMSSPPLRVTVCIFHGLPNS